MNETQGTLARNAHSAPPGGESCPAKGKQRSTVLRQVAGPTYVPRWLAEGFWYVHDFVEGHTSHPAWKGKIAAEQLDSGYAQLS